MRKFLFFVVMLFSLSWLVLDSRAQDDPPPPVKYSGVVEVVALKNSQPARLAETIKIIGRRWGLFPGMDILPVSPEGFSPGALLFRGREGEVKVARSLALSLDGLFVLPEGEQILNPVPLIFLSAPKMKKMLLSLASEAGMTLDPGQLVIFPSGENGTLYYLGSTPEANRIKNLVSSLDQPRYSGFSSHLSAFWKEFCSDFSRHLILVSTYLASVLILIAVHFLLTLIPGLGSGYRKIFTLVWTRLLDGVKGRDFAYEILKKLAEVAVAASGYERSSQIAASSREESLLRAWNSGRELLEYRGFNPDDPAVSEVFTLLLEAELVRRRK